MRNLRIVPKPSNSIFDSITRDSMLRRISFLRRRYCLQWLQDQATFNLPSIECLDDKPLAALLQDMERARECIAEDIAFEDAGLVRAGELPAYD